MERTLGGLCTTQTARRATLDRIFAGIAKTPMRATATWSAAEFADRSTDVIGLMPAFDLTFNHV
jgi:hypothetical protein